MNTPKRSGRSHPKTPAPREALEAFRAFGVVSGPSILLVAGGAAASAAALSGWIFRGTSPTRRAIRPLVALGAALPWAYLFVARPWLQHWGTTPEDAARTYPGDAPGVAPTEYVTRAVTIQAPVSAVWPWLAQIGQDRAGFYSYAWLENLAGCDLENADWIHPEWQQRQVGETLPLHPLSGLKVTIFEPERALGIEGWGTFILEAAGPETTRLIVRERRPHGRSALIYLLALELPHFVMERKMLLGIKERAELEWRAYASRSRPEDIAVGDLVPA